MLPQSEHKYLVSIVSLLLSDSGYPGIESAGNNRVSGFLAYPGCLIRNEDEIGRHIYVWRVSEGILMTTSVRCPQRCEFIPVVSCDPIT